MFKEKKFNSFMSSPYFLSFCLRFLGMFKEALLVHLLREKVYISLVY